MSMHLKLFQALKAVLNNISGITAVVPAANIRPSEDPTQPAAGNTITYTWQAGRVDKKARRGEGSLTLVAASVDNKVSANSILELVRNALSAQSLSYVGSPVVVHRFDEETFTDVGTTDGNRWQAAATFEVRMIEAP